MNGQKIWDRLSKRTVASKGIRSVKSHCKKDQDCASGEEVEPMIGDKQPDRLWGGRKKRSERMNLTHHRKLFTGHRTLGRADHDPQTSKRKGHLKHTGAVKGTITQNIWKMLLFSLTWPELSHVF